jgi:hypothetical protein
VSDIESDEQTSNISVVLAGREAKRSDGDLPQGVIDRGFRKAKLLNHPGISHQMGTDLSKPVLAHLGC